MSAKEYGKVFAYRFYRALLLCKPIPWCLMETLDFHGLTQQQRNRAATIVAKD